MTLDIATFRAEASCRAQNRVEGEFNNVIEYFKWPAPGDTRLDPPQLNEVASNVVSMRCVDLITRQCQHSRSQRKKEKKGKR